MKIEHILNAYTPKTGTVEVPNWGGTVHVKELSTAAMEAIQKADGKELDIAMLTVLYGMIEEDGSQSLKKSDMEKLKTLAPGDIIKVSIEVMNLTKIEDLDDSGKE